MKSRYFLIISVMISLSMLLAISFSFYFFESEIEKSIDSRLETMASSILASGLSVEMMDNLDDVDDLLSDLFPEQRVDRFIRIYRTSDQKLLYANDFGMNAALPPPTGQKLSTVKYGGQYFRTLELKNENFILQVALIRDSILLRIKVFEKNIILFTIGLLLIVLLTTALLFKSMLKPLVNLSHDFKDWSTQLSFDFTKMEDSTQRLRHRIAERSAGLKSGELDSFIESLESFLEKLASYLQFSQKQYSVLAHELKTPLTVIRNQLARNESQEITPILQEVDRLSDLIRNFLYWSQQAADASKPQELYAVKLKSTLEEEVKRFESLYPGRLQLVVGEDVQVYCSKVHIQQVISNLLQNALAHGPQEVVNIELKSDELTIQDRGSGVPDSVLKNLGAPFNKGATSKGHGLGLAWVKVICDLYDWKLTIEKNETGGCFRILFPKT